MPPFVLTLKLDQPSFELLDGLRRQHFPPARNIVPAHITLFHALPGDQQRGLEQTLLAACAATPPFALRFPGVRFLGAGVAVAVEGPALLELRQRLAVSWSGWLSRQDQQAYRPHVTIQNKVSAAEARQLHDRLAATWAPRDGRGMGLLLWRYLGGPWELAREFAFDG